MFAGLFTLTGNAQPVFPAITSRTEAISALERPDPRERASAIAYLGRAGLAGDAPRLLKLLSDENPLIRELAEQNVWRVWSHSREPGLDRLLSEGVSQMQAGDLDQAIATFSRVIRQKPAFAEGWNKRATAWFLKGRLRESLADCDEVIKRNPQHFGALSGYGQIYLRLEEFDKALDYLHRALAVNPNLQGVEAEIEQIEALQRERRRRMI